jgi:hypothetical protein
MHTWIRRLSFLTLLSVVVMTGFAVQHSTASAYGAADAPLAQIEFSGNCNNPNFDFCSDVVGTGGIWLWIEVDDGGIGDVAGAGCGHVVGGVGGPGGAGAESIRGDITWTLVDGGNVPAGAMLPGIVDPNDSYYLVDIGGGELFAFPQTPGHYSFHPAPGVTLQLQIAP